MKEINVFFLVISDRGWGVFQVGIIIPYFCWFNHFIYTGFSQFTGLLLFESTVVHPSLNCHFPALFW